MPSSLSDPMGSDPILAAVLWLQGTLLGTVATTVAVIAVASIGFLLLTGRVNWRYGATVILGCFILFGAGSIVAGLRAAASGAGLGGVPSASLAPAPVPSSPLAELPKPPPYDPYAGAALPSR